MSRPAKVLWCELALALAACSTADRRNGERVPDWAEAEVTPLSATPSASRPPSAPVPPFSALHAPAPQASAAAARTPTRQTPPALTPHSAQPEETWIPLRRWCQSEGFAAPVLLAAGPMPTYALRSPNGTLVLRVGSLVSRWDGLEVQLGFPPQLINGQPYVNTLDLQKTIQPMLEGGPKLRLGSNPVIVIDPGHGGENAGTRSVLGSHYEKEFTLDWALRVKKLLSERGWQVFLTRSNDSDLALSNRVAVAAEHKADLFLSLHFNSAAPNESEAGLETYCLTPAGMPSSLTRGFGDETTAAFPNNAFDAQNLWLALSIQRALLQVNGHNDRGVRRARFPGVLRGQQRPAVLIEGGYLSNPTEARWISDPMYRQKLAAAVAGALTGGGLVAVTESRAGGTNESRGAEVPSPSVQTGRKQPPPGAQRAEARGQNSEEPSHTAEIP